MSKRVVITVGGETWFDQDCGNCEQNNEMVGTHGVRVTFTADYPIDEDIRGMTGTVVDGLISIHGPRPE